MEIHCKWLLSAWICNMNYGLLVNVQGYSQVPYILVTQMTKEQMLVNSTLCAPTHSLLQLAYPALFVF